VFDLRVEYADSDNDSIDLRYFLIMIEKASYLIARMEEYGRTPEEIEQVSKDYHAILDAAKKHVKFGIGELTKKYGC
jgi:hypothetical protein